MPSRPKRWSFTPVTGTATNIRTASAGATGALTLDGALITGGVLATQTLAYYLLLTTTAADQARVLTIVGTDADGAALTEAINLPNATTAITTNAFRSITSATLDAGGATIGSISIGTSNATRAALTPSFPLDVYASNTTIASDISGTINFTVQKCHERLNQGETANWVTAQAAGAIDVVTTLSTPISGMRVLINSYTNGATLATSTLQGAYGR